MAHWDVSSELRGEHGQWSKSGILHRAAEEAKQAGKEKEAAKIEAGHRVSYKGGNSVGTVHHIDEKGVPHVVWDRGRGKPVRTPAHHLSHVGEQVKAEPKPGAPERGAHETPSQERHLDETLRKLSGRQPAAKPEPSLAGRPAAEKRRAALKAGTEKSFMKGERVKHSSGKTGVATGNEKDDPYGHGRRIVEVRWDKGRNSTVYAETLSREPKAGATPGTGGHSPDELRKMIADMEAKQRAKTEAENKARFPGGSTTIRSGSMGGTESAAATRGLRGGGMQKTRSFEEVSKEYDTANAALHRMLDRGGSELAINARRREIGRLEGELRGMGARRSFGTNWEMPPKPGTPAHAQEKLNRELQSITEQLHGTSYDPVSLASTRFQDLSSQLRAGEKTIVLKMPSGSEIQMSRETAQHLRDEATRSALAGNRPQKTTAERRAAQQSRLAEAAQRSGIGNRARPNSETRGTRTVQQGTVTAKQIATVQGQIRRIEDLLKDPQFVSKYGHDERERQVKRLAQKRTLLAGYLGGK